MSKANRDKGHRYERLLAEEFRELGFDKCKTSRYASRMLDDAKVDLYGTEPYNVQAKAYDSNQPNFRNILDEMPKDDNYNVVFHKVKRKEDIVVMKKSDFYALIKHLHKARK